MSGEQKRFEEIAGEFTWPNAPEPSTETWTQETPTAPGWYWYFGKFGYTPTLQTAKVMLAGSEEKHVMHIVSGDFWYPQDHQDEVCWWQRMVPPGLGVAPPVESGGDS